MNSPTIGLTAGDPSGIGPEILAATIQEIEKFPEYLRGCSWTIIGESQAFNPGHPSLKSSLAAIATLEEAASRALSGELAGIVTGPVSKHQLHQAGFAFPGQTEFFAARAGIENFAMLLTGGSLTVALVTAHLPLAKALSALRTEEIVRVGSLLVNFLKQRGISCPRVAVAGLNPHAGEQGDLGEEEALLILPAITILRKKHLEVTWSGPMSPDTVFWQATQGTFDAILCMYHDQGLIPLKLHAFDQGVNLTLGLPFIRTSPDHGTAYNITGTGCARAESYLAALRLTVDLVQH